MNKLKEYLDTTYPMPTDGDVLAELKMSRLRTAFVSGVYLASQALFSAIPSEDKGGREGCCFSDTKLDSVAVTYGYNLALEDVIVAHGNSIKSNLSELNNIL